RLRARIRRGLLKVEQLHALARDIYYGRRGRINARELHEQMNSCSCLTLLLACVVYWQAKEISRVLKIGIPEGEDINISLLGACQPHRMGKRDSLWPVCAQPGRHSLKPTLKGYFYTNLVGTLDSETDISGLRIPVKTHPVSPALHLFQLQLAAL